MLLIRLTNFACGHWPCFDEPLRGFVYCLFCCLLLFTDEISLVATMFLFSIDLFFHLNGYVSVSLCIS